MHFSLIYCDHGVYYSQNHSFYLFIYCSGFCHTLTWISHGFSCVPHPDPPSHLPPHPIPLGFPSAPALSTRLTHPTWADDVSPLIVNLFQCCSLWTSLPRLLPQSPKVCSVHLCLFFCFAYRVILTIFLNSIYIYVLVYCIGLYFSGLLHSV